MSEIQILNPKITITSIGMEVHGTLTKEEWKELGSSIGHVLFTASFIAGDWLVYGEGRDAQGTLFPEIPAQDRIDEGLYKEAQRLTGVDIATLQMFAYVSKRIPKSLRNGILSWEHHKKVAKLKFDSDKTKWLDIAVEEIKSGKPMSTRRLAKSIEMGRVVTREEMASDDADQGADNVHPYVNGIRAFWGSLIRAKWLETATPEQRLSLKADIHPVVDIYQQL